jgi:hypothetical protein
VKRKTTYGNVLKLITNGRMDKDTVDTLNRRAAEILGHPPTGKEQVTWKKDGLYLKGKQLTRVL